MSSQSGITEGQVFEIADQLLGVGQIPTLKGIRDELKTGSFTTIGHHLNKWKKMKLEQSQTPQPPSEFQTSAMRIWEAAYREAEKLFTTEREIFEVKLAQWDVERNDLHSVIAQQELEGQALEERAQDNQARLNQISEELRSAQDCLTKAITQYEENERRRIETLERADRLEAKLTEFLKGSTRRGQEIAETTGTLVGRDKYLEKNKKEVEINLALR
jgi:hypothetical protein